MFDAGNRLASTGAQQRGTKGTGATLGWAIDDPKCIQTLEHRPEPIAEISARYLDTYRGMA